MFLWNIRVKILVFNFYKGIASMSESNQDFKKYMCLLCGLIYDEAEGWPEDGIEPGTRWKDVPDTWLCPDCGAMKEDFEMMEI